MVSARFTIVFFGRRGQAAKIQVSGIPGMSGMAGMAGMARMPFMVFVNVHPVIYRAGKKSGKCRQTREPIYAGESLAIRGELIYAGET